MAKYTYKHHALILSWEMGKQAKRWVLLAAILVELGIACFVMLTQADYGLPTSTVNLEGTFVFRKPCMKNSHRNTPTLMLITHSHALPL